MNCKLIFLTALILGGAGVSRGQDMPARKIARISGGVMAGQILTRVAPVYPAEAKAAGVSGIVVLHAIIGKDGTIEDLQVVSGPEMLGVAAMEAVRQWVYKPYVLNGQPTSVNTTITVNFNLDNSPPPALLAWSR